MKFLEFVSYSLKAVFSFAFYLLAVIAIIKELKTFFNPKATQKKRDEEKKIKWEFKTEEQKDSQYLAILYVVWIVVGLFTSQWLLFLLILLICFVPIKNWIGYKINAGLSLAILIFIIINRFQIHINWLESLIWCFKGEPVC